MIVETQWFFWVKVGLVGLFALDLSILAFLCVCACRYEE